MSDKQDLELERMRLENRKLEADLTHGRRGLLFRPSTWTAATAIGALILQWALSTSKVDAAQLDVKRAEFDLTLKRTALLAETARLEALDEELGRKQEMLTDLEKKIGQLERQIEKLTQEMSAARKTQVSGSAFWKGGGPCAGASVSVVDKRSGATFGTRTDKSGKFTLTVVRGRSYNITVRSIVAYTGIVKATRPAVASQAFVAQRASLRLAPLSIAKPAPPKSIQPRTLQIPRIR